MAVDAVADAGDALAAAAAAVGLEPFPIFSIRTASYLSSTSDSPLSAEALAKPPSPPSWEGGAGRPEPAAAAPVAAAPPDARVPEDRPLARVCRSADDSATEIWDGGDGDTDDDEPAAGTETAL